ncbi:hypothetical protein Cme02nite_12770 [Catellatospora methionotrophica]|uniref:Uncharacterized protein n=1 Tax=Catellatospora methionotrophica TaxID=121620 RepID=A0A8J3LHY2_9ACTN|nr:hypothetical protein [Catellatospora methionotrophica]GIG12945.1 hypothetical protein Cme02nite_12770 [Catellatospora methionotrophica]
MRPQRFLRHLDQVIVPRLAGGFVRVARGRLRMRLLTAAALLGVTGVLLAVVWTAHRGTTTVPEATLGETVQVGVVQGQSVPLYAKQARSELAGLLKRPAATPVETYALVSLKAYLAPERLTPVLGGVSVVEVYARVPLGRTSTASVRIPAFKIPEDVVAGMRQVAARRDTDAADFQGLAGKLTTADAEEQRLRDTYLGGSEVARAEAEAYRKGCTCVYAAVVRATPVALDQIASRPEVRAVDPAPEVRRLDRAVFLPPLPEQVGQLDPSASPSASAAASPSASPSAQPSRTPSAEPSDPGGGPSDPGPASPPASPVAETSPSDDGPASPPASPAHAPSAAASEAGEAG